MPMPTHPLSSRPSSSAGHANGLLIHHTTPNSPLYEDELPASSKAPLKYALKDIHPDDSKDKVFAAILKALLYLRNKPSSPKELANCIMKNKYTMLGYVTHTPSFLSFFVFPSIYSYFRCCVHDTRPGCPILSHRLSGERTRQAETAKRKPLYHLFRVEKGRFVRISFFGQDFPWRVGLAITVPNCNCPRTMRNRRGSPKDSLTGHCVFCITL
ncbi:MAG: hypothetical protein BYD32DRAFT_162124 [Podila humilis]|nr:MAG: hypothetical protein BYD32DRAFT_162124 [Podila humilis]